MNRQPVANYALSVLVVLLLASCTTLYKTTVSLTQIVDGAAKEYSRIYNDGLVSPGVAEKVAVAFKNYQTDAKIAHDALVAYKLSGDPATFNQAMEAARASANGFILLVIQFLAPQDAIALQVQLKRATVP